MAVVADGSPARIRAWFETTSRSWDAIRPYTTTANEAAASDSEIKALVDEWYDEAISDVEDGLTQAVDSPPESGASVAFSRSPSSTTSPATGRKGTGGPTGSRSSGPDRQLGGPAGEPR